jgi:hypothetical protein
MSPYKGDGPDSYAQASAADAMKPPKPRRAGNTLTASVSTDGIAWKVVGTESFAALPATVYVGLAVTSHARGTLASATFDGVAIVQ